MSFRASSVALVMGKGASGFDYLSESDLLASWQADKASYFPNSDGSQWIEETGAGARTLDQATGGNQPDVSSLPGVIFGAGETMTPSSNLVLPGDFALFSGLNRAVSASDLTLWELTGATDYIRLRGNNTVRVRINSTNYNSSSIIVPTTDQILYIGRTGTDLKFSINGGAIETVSAASTSTQYDRLAKVSLGFLGINYFDLFYTKYIADPSAIIAELNTRYSLY